MRIERVGDVEELGRAVAAAIVDVCAVRQSAGEIPCVVLTGGTSGAKVLEALGSHPDRERVDWRRVRFVWGDERWLPAGDPERNDRLADELLFAHLDVNGELVHRVGTSDADARLDAAAEAYASVIDAIDRIDVCLLGVGEDGHVASLFPGRSEAGGAPDSVQAPASEASALPVRESPKPPAERVTLSLAALRRSGRVWLLAAGAGKRDAIRALRERTEPLVPAALVSGTVETVLWADTPALGESHSIDG